MTKTDIVIIDNQIIFREMLKDLLEKNGDFQVVGEGAVLSDIPELYKKHQPDLFLLEFNPIDTTNRSVTRKIVESIPESKIITLTTHDAEPHVLYWLRAGVSGYLLKDMDGQSIINAIHTIDAGGTYIHEKVMHHFLMDYRHLAVKEHNGYFQQRETRKPFHLLTVRECEVLQLLTDGNSNRSISEKIFISEKTVKNHVSSILYKMEVVDRTNAVVTAIKNGWVVVQ